MRNLVLPLAFAVVGTFAFAQTNPQDHAAHHPDASSASATTPAQGTPTPPVSAESFGQQMKQMQDMHERIQAAKTPRERAALMDEQMKLMQSGMEMMGRMGGGAGPGMGMGMMGGQGMPGAAGAAPGTPGANQQQPGPAAGMGGMMGGMMGMHAQMEQRMAMMQMMMQMMMDREAGSPKR